MHRLTTSGIGNFQSIPQCIRNKWCQRLLSTVKSENSSLKSTETAEVEEVKIKVPWGHLSGKWWGPKDVRPILSLHGWQDNAGTFDNLIPRLPMHLSFLALDLPGHGLSSRLPDGEYYSTANVIHVINTVRHFYKWEKLSLMSHSMSSIISFVYSSLFPDQCDLVIALDALKPFQKRPEHLLEQLPKLGDEFYNIDQRNQRKLSPPSYTYDELIDRWVQGTNSSVTKDGAAILVKRAIAPSANDPNRFYFTRDSRLKVFNFSIISQELCIEMAKRIRIPYMFIKAAHSPYYENKRYFDEVIQIMQNNNSKFEFYRVNGTHHCHLTEPSLIDKQISEFLLKYRPE